MRSYRWIRCFKPLLTLTASWAFYLFLASLYQEKTAKVKVNECNNEASTINTTTTTTEVPIQRDHQAIFKALIDTNSTFLGQFCECDGKEELLVFIHSKSHDVNLRNLIRNTWGSRRLRSLTKARIFFVVGHSNSSNSLRQDLIWENDIHNDIIEGPFDETGLTEFEDIKFMIWLKWYRIQCPNAPFAFNIDANRNAVDLIQLAELASSLNSNNYELIFGIDDEYSYLMTNVTGQRLYSLLLEKRSFNLEPSYLNRHLAPEARLSALKDIGLPIIRAESMDAQERYWEEMKKKHGLADDITRPVFLTNFTTTSYENYVINEPDYCQTTWRGIEDLIVVHSNPSQEDFRTHIRITWGDERIFETLKMRPLFFLGRSADPLVEERVKSEAAKFGDIIQTDYLDTYKNLTYKAVSWMLWVKLYCSGISSLVKTDDDIVVDVFKLKNYSERVSNSDRIFCHYWKYGRIFRDPRNKHYVSEETFAKKKFPPYCSGSAYILNAKISRVTFSLTFETFIPIYSGCDENRFFFFASS